MDSGQIYIRVESTARLTYRDEQQSFKVFMAELWTKP